MTCIVEKAEKPSFHTDSPAVGKRLPSPPSPLPRRGRDGAEGGVRAPSPGLAPWATILRPRRGCGTAARNGKTLSAELLSQDPTVPRNSLTGWKGNAKL